MKFEAMSALEKSGHWQQTLSLDRFWMCEICGHIIHMSDMSSFVSFPPVCFTRIKVRSTGDTDLDLVNGLESNLG